MLLPLLPTAGPRLSRPAGEGRPGDALMQLIADLQSDDFSARAVAAVALARQVRCAWDSEAAQSERCRRAGAFRLQQYAIAFEVLATQDTAW